VSSPIVDAILVTFDSSRPLAETCRSALGQTIPPRTLVVVDNNRSPVAPAVVNELGPSDTEVRVLHPGVNLGPAGGFTAGFEHLRENLGGLDWVLLLDDDDPLPAPDIVERLLKALDSPGPTERVGGIGLMGAVFRTRILLLASIELRPGGLIPVDSLHGWAAPLYRAAALEEVGCFRSELFWGLEELDLGIRLTRSGWRLYVAADVFRALPTPRKVVERPGLPRARLADPSPRDYYRIRNTVDIGLRYFGLANVLFAMTVRGLLKPTANLPFHPLAALRALRQNIRAIVDGFRGHLGERVSLRE
jgi:rhamnosyltransferase